MLKHYKTCPFDIFSWLSDESNILFYFLESILDADLQDELRGNLQSVVSDILIPLVVRNLGYNDATIDKAAQSALIQLIEQGFISKLQIEIQVCPSILALSKCETQNALHANIGAITVSF